MSVKNSALYPFVYKFLCDCKFTKSANSFRTEAKVVSLWLLLYHCWVL